MNDNLEREIDYSFKDKKLLNKAITHSSISKSNNYEKLEFLGDSIINFYTSDWLYTNFKNDSEENLSVKRAQLVNKKFLALVSKQLKLFKYLKIIKNIEISERIHCDIFESLVGAIYLDSSYEKVSLFLNNTIIKYKQSFDKHNDYKGPILNLFNQGKIKKLNINTTFSSKLKKFICRIEMNNNYYYGFANNKIESEQKASKYVLMDNQ